MKKTIAQWKMDSGIAVMPEKSLNRVPVPRLVNLYDNEETKYEEANGEALNSRNLSNLKMALFFTHIQSRLGQE